MYLEYYLKQLSIDSMPSFLKKYLVSPSLLRLKKIGYFCGMDYASDNIYNFREYISRYDHSLTVSLLTWKLTHNKTSTLAGLFHDIATPCFSHVIDYMNKDYDKQESTEEKTASIILNDTYLLNCFKEDHINIEDIINFKKITVVDNDRPKLCADRIDGIILTGIGWTKNITLEEISEIVNNLCIFKNEDNEDEISFKDLRTAIKVIKINESIDKFCHSNEDNYMMELLAKITKYAINNKYITYDDLYNYGEEELLSYLEKTCDELNKLIYLFKNIKKEEIEDVNLPSVKARIIKPIVNKSRIM